MPIAGAGRAIAGPPAEILNPTAVDDIKCGIGFDTVVSVMSYYIYKFKSLVVLKFAPGRFTPEYSNDLGLTTFSTCETIRE